MCIRDRSTESALGSVAACSRRRWSTARPSAADTIASLPGLGPSHLIVELSLLSGSPVCELPWNVESTESGLRDNTVSGSRFQAKMIVRPTISHPCPGVLYYLWANGDLSGQPPFKPWHGPNSGRTVSLSSFHRPTASSSDLCRIGNDRLQSPYFVAHYSYGNKHNGMCLPVSFVIL